MCDERIEFIDVFVSIARILWALETILWAFMFQTASGNRGGLIPEATALTVPDEVIWT